VNGIDRLTAAAIEAAVERIIPSDDGRAGAREAGTAAYVLAQVVAAGADALAAFAAAAADLDTAAGRRRPGTAFADLGPAEQDAILRELETADPTFFLGLVESAMEGFYGDPRHGGNRGAASWDLIGFPGPTGGTGYRSPLGWYDAHEPVLPGLEDAPS
jgi:gluconate 2-dehydrogenase gamma chain